MLVVTRFTVPPEQAETFRAEARAALDALAARPGWRGGRLARAADDATAWLLLTEWDGVGAWRRALGGYDVKMYANPLLARAHDEPSAYEVLDDTATGPADSDRAPDADVAGPGGGRPTG